MLNCSLILCLVYTQLLPNIHRVQTDLYNSDSSSSSCIRLLFITAAASSGAGCSLLRTRENWGKMQRPAYLPQNTRENLRCFQAEGWLGKQGMKSQELGSEPPIRCLEAPKQRRESKGRAHLMLENEIWGPGNQPARPPCSPALSINILQIQDFHIFKWVKQWEEFQCKCN